MGNFNASEFEFLKPAICSKKIGKHVLHYDFISSIRLLQRLLLVKLTFNAFSSQAMVLISSRFIPEPSDRSIGAILPRNREHAKEDTRDIRVEAWYARGLVRNIFRI